MGFNELIQKASIDYILPGGINFENTDVFRIDYESNMAYAENNNRYNYTYLIFACGLERNYENIQGLDFAIKNDQIPLFDISTDECFRKQDFYVSSLKSNTFEKTSYSFANFLKTKEGNIVFTSGDSSILNQIHLLYNLKLFYTSLTSNSNILNSSKIIINLILPNNDSLKLESSSNPFLFKIYEYYIRQIENLPNVKIRHEGPLQKINENNELVYNETSLKYDLCFIYPELIYPKFILRGSNIEEISKRSNIFYIGEILNNSIDRTTINCFMQSIYLANILKSIQYKMKNKFTLNNLSYTPEQLLFHYYKNELIIFSLCKNNDLVVTLKKNGILLKKTHSDFIFKPISFWGRIFIKYFLGMEIYKKIIISKKIKFN